MKTLEKLYEEVIASEELKAEVLEAAKDEKTLADFLKKNDCDASIDDLKAFLKEKSEGEISDDDVEAVAGGDKTGTAVALSILSLGVGCGIAAIASTREKDKGQCAI